MGDEDAPRGPQRARARDRDEPRAKAAVVPATRGTFLGRGIASHYGYGDIFHGRPTANGERFDRNGMTCAMQRYPRGTVPAGRDYDRLQPCAQAKVRPLSASQLPAGFPLELSDAISSGADPRRAQGQVWVRVVLEEGPSPRRQIFVRVTDRGPYENGRCDRRDRRTRYQIPHPERIIDLSSGALRTLLGDGGQGSPSRGLVPVSVWLVERPG